VVSHATYVHSHATYFAPRCGTRSACPAFRVKLLVFAEGKRGARGCFRLWMMQLEAIGKRSHYQNQQHVLGDGH
jgi:hypothetical protein